MSGYLEEAGRRKENLGQWLECPGSQRENACLGKAEHAGVQRSAGVSETEWKAREEIPWSWRWSAVWREQPQVNSVVGRRGLIYDSGGKVHLSSISSGSCFKSVGFGVVSSCAATARSASALVVVALQLRLVIRGLLFLSLASSFVMVVQEPGTLMMLQRSCSIGAGAGTEMRSGVARLSERKFKDNKRAQAHSERCRKRIEERLRTTPHGAERLDRRSEVINEALAEEVRREEQRKNRSNRASAAIPETKPPAPAVSEPRDRIEPDPNPKRRLIMKSASPTASGS